jgi:hypothetical protein
MKRSENRAQDTSWGSDTVTINGDCWHSPGLSVAPIVLSCSTGRQSCPRKRKQEEALEAA